MNGPVSADDTSSQIATQQHDTPALKRSRYSALKQWLIDDWHTQKAVPFAILLLVLTILPTVAYYVNLPAPEINADTPAYLTVVQRIQSHFLLVDAWRLPVYPLLVVVVYLFAGQGNLVAVGTVHAALFVLATLELYILSLLILRRTWLAFLIGLLVGTNIVILSYVKPIMTEGLTLWLLTTMELLLLYFTRTLRTRAFWFVALWIPLLFFTRPEWLYLPVPLFAYLLLITVRKAGWSKTRHMLKHMLLALVVIYALAGGYIVLNKLINHYPGMSQIENFNWMGKVLQYNMQDEADPQDAHLSRLLDPYVAKGNRNPYHILPYTPELSQDFAIPAGKFARTIILHHPVEFILKSIPVIWSSLTSYFDVFRPNVVGPFQQPLAWLKSVHRTLYGLNALFPACAVLWLFLLCWRRTRTQQMVLEMGVIVLLVAYPLIVTSLGGYTIYDYMRTHIPFDPLLIMTIWGTVGTIVVWAISWLARILTARTSNHAS